MRVLHISKPSEGGRWAALQVRELVRNGVAMDVALPVSQMVSAQRTGAEIKQIYEHILGLAAARPAEFDSPDAWSSELSAAAD